MPDFVAVIMAGGKGQRFWPLSTELRPKQFLDLEQSGRTLLQNTYDRLLPIAKSSHNVFVATGQGYVDLVREQLPDLPQTNLIIEPVSKDSAPAIAYTSLEIEARFGDILVGFFPSDHRIAKRRAYRETILSATALATRTKGIVTIGITPDRPATGYGYIQRGKQTGDGYHVLKFAEKPNAKKAQTYIESGKYYWNAGIFICHISSMLTELDKHTPFLTKSLRRAMKTGSITETFSKLENISIDFAVMEHTKDAYVVLGNFGWDDIGDWVALERLLNRKNETTNTVVGKHIGLEAKGNIIYTENAEDVIVTLGVSDLVVVKRGNTVFLVHKEKVQDIKHLLEDERLAALVMLDD